MRGQLLVNIEYTSVNAMLHRALTQLSLYQCSTLHSLKSQLHPQQIRNVESLPQKSKSYVTFVVLDYLDGVWRG